MGRLELADGGRVRRRDGAVSIVDIAALRDPDGGEIAAGAEAVILAGLAFVAGLLPAAIDRITPFVVHDDLGFADRCALPRRALGADPLAGRVVENVDAFIAAADLAVFEHALAGDDAVHRIVAVPMVLDRASDRAAVRVDRRILGPDATDIAVGVIFILEAGGRRGRVAHLAPRPHPAQRVVGGRRVLVDVAIGDEHRLGRLGGVLRPELTAALRILFQGQDGSSGA